MAKSTPLPSATRLSKSRTLDGMSSTSTFTPADQATALIEAVAATERLLVVSDFDGTLADFATDIYAVTPHPDSMKALTRLAHAPHTTVALLSGRHLEGLRRVAQVDDPFIFGGSHGAESSDSAENLTPAMADHLAAIEEQLQAIADQYPGTFIEVKPFQRVFHTRKLAQDNPLAAQEAFTLVSAIDPGDYPKTVGKGVVEFSATAATKGTWIQQRREISDATAVIFIGDDTTDEHGLEVLNQPPDLGVKVGNGETAATLRVDGIDGAAKFFTELADARLRHVGN